MKKLNLHEMYLLGKRLNPLTTLEGNSKTSASLFYLWFARSALNDMTGTDSPLLEAAKRAARALSSSITDAIPSDLDEAMKIDKDKELDYSAYRIKQDLEAFESVLSNEIPGVPAYIVSQKGIYRTEDLIDHAERQFPSEFQPEIPAQAVADIREAGKCLAFSLPTACSFHLWRALETVMDAYYARITSSSFEADKVSRNWGAKIKALQGKGAETAVTEYLDHIRKQYRNPQTHPEEVVELNESLMLFGTAASAITAMITAIQKLKDTARLGNLVAALASPGQSS